MCVNEFTMFHDGVVKTIRKFVFECKIMHDRLVFQIDGGDKKNVDSIILLGFSNILHYKELRKWY